MTDQDDQMTFAPLSDFDVQLYSLGDFYGGAGGQTFFMNLRDAVRAAADRRTGTPCLRIFRPANATGGACYVDFLCDDELRAAARMSAARLDHLEKELRAGQQISPRFDQNFWEGVPA